MKRILTAVLGLCFFIAALPSHALMLSLTPTSQSVTSGQNLQFSLIATGGSGLQNSLSVYDVDVSFDPTLLNFTGAVFGDPVLGNQLDLTGLGTFTDVVIGAGSVNLFELSFDDPTDLATLQAANFTLATLNFTGLASGTAALGLNINVLADESGNALNAVPEPSALALAMIGLFALVTVRARRA